MDYERLYQSLLDLIILGFVDAGYSPGEAYDLGQAPDFG